MGRAAPLSGRVVVTGAHGMLGRAMVTLLRERSAHVIATGRSEIDITDAASVRSGVTQGCGIVINCAAYTDVDGAEKDINAARTLNANGVDVLAKRCREVGAKLVHFSTDYVFDGEATHDGRAAKPYTVDQPKRPLNAYGVSKAEGEDAILASGAEFIVLRTSWLYAPWGKNFVRTIAKFGGERPVLKVVNDQRGRPTSAEQLAVTTLAMIDAGARGIHHATDAGECTWYDFASEIVSVLGLPARVEPCTTAEFPRPAKRPAYSVLDLSATEAMIGPMKPWRETLAAVLRRLERPL